MKASKFKKLFFKSPSQHRAFLGSHLSPTSKRSWQPAAANEESEERMFIGGVLVACSTLVWVIQIGFLTAAPLCNSVSGFLFSTGIYYMNSGADQKIWPKDKVTYDDTNTQ